MAALGEESRLCLEPLTVLDCSAEACVDIAATVGCPLMSLWVQPPGTNFPAQCLVEKGSMAERLSRRMADNGIRALNLEVFDLTAEVRPQMYRPALELGASLGAACASAIFRNNPDPGRRLEQFVELCQIAAEFKLRVNAEFISYQSLGSLEQAIDLVERAGQPNAGIVVDILHLVRSGGSPDQVREMDQRLIGHAQLCDGPRTIAPEARSVESSGDRMVPGEGDFPVRAFLRALPRIPIGIEVPFKSPGLQGLTPLERVERIVRATRGVMMEGDSASSR